MKTITLTYSNKSATYKMIEVEGKKPVVYRLGASDTIINIIERARLNRTRLFFDYGDIVTGKSWGETYDIAGYIGLSVGTDARYPLLVHNTRSISGGLLMCDAIVKISESKGKRVLYQHPNYRTEK